MFHSKSTDDIKRSKSDPWVNKMMNISVKPRKSLTTICADDDIENDSDYSSDSEETLFSYDNLNTIVMFKKSNDINAISKCLELRNSMKIKVKPLEFNEYYNNNNKYFMCYITNGSRTNFIDFMLGYILYNIEYDKEIKHHVLNILDIIFCNFDDLGNVNIAHAKKKCIQSFSDYVKQTNYYCKWRPNILYPIDNMYDKYMG